MRSKGILILAVLLISMARYGNEIEIKSREVITAQWETLKKLSDAIPRKTGGGVTSLLTEDAVTTNLADAYQGGAVRQRYETRRTKARRDIAHG